ncbi:hypothetical protein [Vibrio sp. 10N]|uniref:hypothetical protein n=1 Tax=Vibrio sp. 10N TaxID=3058938 RepID=UPI0028129133|nr:hypothetical protein VB10N_46250 [Vibrio sp. 10N]
MDAPINFKTYKSEFSLWGESEDLFIDTELYGCNETEFEKWLNNQRLFIKRYATSTYTQLKDMQMPTKKWSFFQMHYERQTRTNYLVNRYPDGFFEAKGKDEDEVACFLPDTYGKKKYRISFYRKNGPVNHETYSHRLDALSHLANRGFTACEGALDALVGTNEWNRGLYITKWLAEGIHPMDGLKRESHKPEVQMLFADAL